MVVFDGIINTLLFTTVTRQRGREQNINSNIRDKITFRPIVFLTGICWLLAVNTRSLTSPTTFVKYDPHSTSQ